MISTLLLTLTLSVTGNPEKLEFQTADSKVIGIVNSNTISEPIIPDTQASAGQTCEDVCDNWAYKRNTDFLIDLPWFWGGRIQLGAQETDWYNYCWDYYSCLMALCGYPECY